MRPRGRVVTRRARRVLGVGLLAATGSLGACARAPLPEDPDGAAGLARDLVIGEERRDSLECIRNDCVDWFRIYVQAEGTLSLVADSPDPTADAGIELFLGDDRADLIDRTSFTRRGRLQQRVRKGYHFVRLATRSDRALRYVLRASFEPREVAAPPRRRAPPPAPPRVRALPGRVVEVEGRAGRVDGVLFRVDDAASLRTGLRGRLLSGNDVIGEVEVTEIYSGGGARARVLGPLRARIDATTRLEIDVPTSAR